MVPFSVVNYEGYTELLVGFYRRHYQHIIRYYRATLLQWVENQ